MGPIEKIHRSICAEPVIEYTTEPQQYFYDERNKIKLYQGDSQELLKNIPEKCVDLIFADPPYFGNQSGLIMKRTDGHSSTFDTKKATWAFNKSLDFQFNFHRTWLKEAQRILKDGATIWITGTYHSIGVINVVLQDLKFKILNDVILVKKNAPPNFKGSCFRAITETMIWAKKNTNGKTKFNYWLMKKINNGTQMNNVWEYWAEKNPFRFPASKQPIILENVILAGTSEGDVILDPFAGSGTTGFVAKTLKRKCILIEINPDYCKLIKERIEGKYGDYKRKTDPQIGLSL